MSRYNYKVYYHLLTYQCLKEIMTNFTSLLQVLNPLGRMPLLGTAHVYVHQTFLMTYSDYCHWKPVYASFWWNWKVFTECLQKCEHRKLILISIELQIRNKSFSVSIVFHWLQSKWKCNFLTQVFFFCFTVKTIC